MNATEIEAADALEAYFTEVSTTDDEDLLNEFMHDFYRDPDSDPKSLVNTTYMQTFIDLYEAEDEELSTDETSFIGNYIMFRENYTDFLEIYEEQFLTLTEAISFDIV